VASHRHAASSTWEAEYGGRLEHPLRKGLSVFVEKQWRAFYPPGSDSAACCSEERTILRVSGVIKSARDLRLVLAKLSHLQDQIRPEVRR
jgi:hypothetical protein